MAAVGYGNGVGEVVLIPGPPGPPGPFPHLVWGETEQAAPGEGPQTVIDDSDPENIKIHFVLPKGDKGDSWGTTRVWLPYQLTSSQAIYYVADDGGAWQALDKHLTAGSWADEIAAHPAAWQQIARRGDVGPMPNVTFAPVIEVPAGYPTKAYNVSDDPANPVVQFEIPLAKPVASVQAPTIASALNIGLAPGQNRWNVQLSQRSVPASVSNPNPTQPTGFLTLAPNDFLIGTTAPECQVSPDGFGVDLMTYIDAWAGTTGSATPRAEFRELDQISGASAAWDPAGGYHLFQATYEILELPTKDAIKPEVVLHQVHNNNNDVFCLRATVSTDVNGFANLKLTIRINGSTTPTAQSGLAGGVIQYPIVIGSRFDIKTEILNGDLKFWLAPAGGNFGDNFADANPTYYTTLPFQGLGVDVKGTDSKTPTMNALGYGVKADGVTSYKSGSTFVQDANGNWVPAWYFKFGQYAQTNLNLEGYPDPKISGGGAPSAPGKLMGTSGPLVTGSTGGRFRTRWSRVKHWHQMSGGAVWPAPNRIDLGVAIPGPIGDPGPGATVGIDSVATVPNKPDGTPGDASVVNVGTSSNAALVFGVPVGPPGDSAYSVAVKNGFNGTAAAWLASLVGPQGLSAFQVAVASGYAGDVTTWLLSLKGDKGEKGDRGDTGISGLNPQGGWAAPSSYVYRDMVEWDGSSYYALAAPPAAGVPPTGTTATPAADPHAVNPGWAFLALHGAKGDKGDQGLKGDTGPRGTREWSGYGDPSTQDQSLWLPGDTYYDRSTGDEWTVS